MNYYKRHIGDYMKATAHLSLLEHGVYNRLLDVYYTRESGIPEDQAARLVSARSKDELAALKIVLAEFFFEVDGVWMNNRCEEEIEAQNARAEKNREVGKKGGRPPKTETQTVSENNPNGFQTETQTVSENNPSHKPLAISHKPGNSKTTTPPASGRSPSGKPDDVLDSTWADFIALRKAKRSPMTATALSAIRTEAGKAGITLQAALVECCARGWQGFRADWMQQGQPRASPPGRAVNGKQAATEYFWEQMNGKRCEVRDSIDGEAVRVD
jgi:uncharacterized protein YdaU (DUF1376 family)